MKEDNADEYFYEEFGENEDEKEYIETTVEKRFNRRR